MSYKGKLEDIKLIAGRSNMQLAKLISTKLGIPLLNRCLDDFANRELKVELSESVRNADIFILQTGCSHSNHSINDYLIELVAMADACRRSSSRSITALIPCYPYSRSDKKDHPRVPIMGAVVATMLKTAGISRIVSMDLHSGQIQGFCDEGFDNLFAINLHINNLNEKYFKGMTVNEINDNFVLVSPDNGGIKRIEAYAQKLRMNYVTMHKQRDYTKKNTVLRSVLIGDPKLLIDRTAIIIDDMVDTMGTMIATIEELKSMGLENVIIIATHGIFSPPALDRIIKSDVIKKVIVTNTIPQELNCKATDKIEVVDISDLYAKIVKRLVKGGSISKLFHEIK